MYYRPVYYINLKGYNRGSCLSPRKKSRQVRTSTATAFIAPAIRKELDFILKSKSAKEKICLREKKYLKPKTGPNFTIKISLNNKVKKYINNKNILTLSKCKECIFEMFM